MSQSMEDRLKERDAILEIANMCSRQDMADMLYSDGYRMHHSMWDSLVGSKELYHYGVS